MVGHYIECCQFENLTGNNWCCSYFIHCEVDGSNRPPFRALFSANRSRRVHNSIFELHLSRRVYYFTRSTFLSIKTLNSTKCVWKWNRPLTRHSLIIFHWVLPSDDRVSGLSMFIEQINWAAFKNENENNDIAIWHQFHEGQFMSHQVGEFGAGIRNDNCPLELLMCPATVRYLPTEQQTTQEKYWTKTAFNAPIMAWRLITNYKVQN